MVTVSLVVNITKNVGLSIMQNQGFSDTIKYMDEDTLKSFEEQNKKLNEIYRSVEKTRKYFLWTLIITVAVIVLPLIGILFLIPQIIKIYSSGLGL